MARGTPREEDRDSTDGLYGTSQVRNMRQTFNAATGIALTELLILARQRMCKEPIDRIWAVLGLFHPQLREAILSIGCTDYSLIGKAQFWRSYIDLAKWVILRDETLAWLSIAASEKPPEIPSWCPNWAAPEAYPSFASINFYSSGYDSLTPRQSRVLLVPNLDKIQVPGFRIDKVKKVIDMYNSVLAADASGLAKQSQIFLEWESRCLKLSQETYCMPDDIPDAHWRTLIGDTISEKFPKQACLEDVKDSYLLCIEFNKVLKVGAMTPSQASLDFAKGQAYMRAFGTAALSQHFF
jgi:hypothetical protein